jgi:hypothetical protein
LEPLIEIIANHKHELPTEYDKACQLLRLAEMVSNEKLAKKATEAVELLSKPTNSFVLRSTVLKTGIQLLGRTRALVGNEGPNVAQLGRAKFPMRAGIYTAELDYRVVYQGDLIGGAYDIVQGISAATPNPYGGKRFTAESFSVRAVSNFLVFDQIANPIRTPTSSIWVDQKSTSLGYFLGGSNNGAVTVEAAPPKIAEILDKLKGTIFLQGKASFRVTAPSLATFSHIFRVCRTFGYDMKSNNLFIIRPIEELKSILRTFEKSQIDPDPSIRTIVSLTYPPDSIV